MLDYETTMRIRQPRYQDVLDHLVDVGLPASFTQTGPSAPAHRRCHSAHEGR